MGFFKYLYYNGVFDILFFVFLVSAGIFKFAVGNTKIAFILLLITLLVVVVEKGTRRSIAKELLMQIDQGFANIEKYIFEDDEDE